MTTVDLRGRSPREVIGIADGMVRERADELWVESLETLMAAGASQSELAAERDEFYRQVDSVLDSVTEQIAEDQLGADIAQAITNAWRRVFDEVAV